MSDEAYDIYIAGHLSLAQTKLGTAANCHMELTIMKSLTVFGNLREVAPLE